MYGRPKFLGAILRFSMGWVFFYAGITKILDSSWSSKGFLENAESFQALFSWLANPHNLLWVDFLNKWGVAALGVALMLGVFTNIAASFGILVMLLYYLPGLNFPFVGEHSLLIDEHIIYTLALLLVMRIRAGKDYSITSLFRRRTVV